MLQLAHGLETGRYPFKQMKLTILPPGPTHKSGLYPKPMAFSGLRTGAVKGKQKRKRPKRGRRALPDDSKLNTKAGQRALDRQKAKEERGRLIVLSIEKAAGINRK